MAESGLPGKNNRTRLSLGQSSKRTSRLGTVAALLCINSPVFVGPIAHALKGADLSAIIGPLVAAGVYFALARSARRMGRGLPLELNPVGTGDFVDTAQPAED